MLPTRLQLVFLAKLVITSQLGHSRREIMVQYCFAQQLESSINISNYDRHLLRLRLPQHFSIVFLTRYPGAWSILGDTPCQ